MSTYTPNNLYVYFAAFTGAQSGLLGALFQEGSNPATYADSNAIVGAWAQAVDTVWADSGSPDYYQTSAIEELSKVQWIGRGTGPSPGNKNPTTYIVAASALIAIVTSGETYLAGQSIVPPAPPIAPTVVAINGDVIPWGETTLSNGTSTDATITVVGTSPGDQIVATPPSDFPSGLFLTALVTDAETVELTVINNSGLPQDIPILDTDVYTLRISA